MLTTLLFLTSYHLLLASCNPINVTALSTTDKITQKYSPELPDSIGPAQSPGHPASLFNPHNLTCNTLESLNKSAQWQAVEGDSIMQSFNTLYMDNRMTCNECFGLQQRECKSANSTDCQKGGLRDQATVNGVARYDRASFIFSGLQVNNTFQCSLPSSGCVAPTCALSPNGPGAWLLLEAFADLSDSFKVYDDQIQDAKSSVQTQALDASDIFANVFASKWKSQVDNSTFASWLNAISLTIRQTYTTATTALFTLGSLTVTNPTANAQNSQTTITITQLSQSGALLTPSAPSPTTTHKFSLLLLQQLALETWSHVATDNIAHFPFITYDTVPCPSVDPKKLGSLAKNALFRNVDTDSGITLNGNCYYLLDAIPSGKGEKSCSGVEPPAGATNKTLTENAAGLGGLSVADWVVPAVMGFGANGGVNGYKTAMEEGVLVNDPQQAAVVSIPVCDFVRNQNAPGKGCPQIGKRSLVNGRIKACAVY